MGTLAPVTPMATGDQRCEEAIKSAQAPPQENGDQPEQPLIPSDHRVNIDELLALLDPTKTKAAAHLVFIKAEYTPMVPSISDLVRETVDKIGACGCVCV